MIIEYDGHVKYSTALLYFYASWASKCNIHLEAIKRIEAENKDYQIIRINTTKFPEMKEQYKITKIPSYVMIDNNQETARINGMVDQYSLAKWVRKHRG